MESTKRKASGELVSPPNKRPRRDTYEGDEQAPSPSPSQGLEATSTSPAASQSPSVSRSPPSSPFPRPSPLPSSPSVSALEAEEEAEEAHDDLLCRIQSGIAYTREQQSKGEAIQQTTRFDLSTTTPSRALDLLRRHATQIYTSDTHEVYELGVPRPDWVTAGIIPGLHDPQWWLDKSLAEIKAGPFAEESDVKRAAANLKGLQTRMSKKKVPTAREKEIEWKLREGTRRQERGLRMYDTDSEETEDESEEIETESEESEEDMPVKRGVRSRAAKAPRSRARLWVIDEVESESESEDDVPLLRDPS